MQLASNDIVRVRVHSHLLSSISSSHHHPTQMWINRVRWRAGPRCGRWCRRRRRGRIRRIEISKRGRRNERTVKTRAKIVGVGWWLFTKTTTRGVVHVRERGCGRPGHRTVCRLCRSGLLCKVHTPLETRGIESTIRSESERHT